MKYFNTIITAVLVLGFIAWQSVFIVHEGERGLVTRFAKVLRDDNGNLRIYEPGPYFKMPFIDKILILDAKIQSLNSKEDRFVTSEKKDLIIDSYVMWKIADFGKFYLSTKGDRYLAEELLRNKITNSLRSQIGLLNIKQIVSGKTGDEADYLNNNSSKTAEPKSKAQQLASESKRDQVMQNALASTKDSAAELGIKIIDVRIMKINLPSEVSSSIYQRMRAERESVARLHRSEGRKEAEVIKADADRQAVVRLAEAEKEAKVIRSKGDAAATKIYADAYSQDPEFFDFLRSMEAYKNSVKNGGNVIVTDDSSSFLKQFQ